VCIAGQHHHVINNVCSIIQEQTALKGQEVTPVIVLTTEPLYAPVSTPDADFYRVKDKSCKDLDMEHNTPSHSPVVSRRNSFIHKARLRKEPALESAVNECKSQSEAHSEHADINADRKRKRDIGPDDYEPHCKQRRLDDTLASESNTNSKDNE